MESHAQQSTRGTRRRATHVWWLGSICAACLLMGGCDRAQESVAPLPSEPSEPRWAEQVAAVRAGESVEIVLANEAVTDDELAEVADLPQLEVLDVRRGRAGSRLAEAVVLCPALRVLRLGETSLDDDAFARLADLADLETLNLDTCEVTDRGLEDLAHLEHLEMLRLGAPGITNQGLASIGRMASLRYLILRDAPVSDAGLAHLGQLEALESLYLEGTLVTDEGVARLVESLPSLHVHW